MKAMAVVALAVGMAMTAGAQAADRAKVTRPQLQKVVSMLAEVRPADWQGYSIKTGQPAVKIQQPERGVMVALIGPADDVAEVVAMLRLDNETVRSRMQLIVSLVCEMAPADDCHTWAIKAMTEVGKANGGERHGEGHGRRITIGATPPSLLRLTIEPM